MAPGIQAVVSAAQAWLQSSWQVQVPFAWLEACVEWLQGEAGGAAHLSQQQINQQALDQWLLTDLRDLDFPVLPEGLAQAQKTELCGTFCVQVDSLLDISQPVYGQLQKWRGTDCANDEVSAVTQATQRSWEAKPTRMLLLQVTDGVQSLEAMEYQPIPVLSAALRPGAKLQLHGKIVCRLGVLLLGPSNIKILGGEVEDLVDRNNQGRVLCRTLGLPDEEQQQEGEEAPAQQQGNQEVEELDLDDAELLASLEAQEEVEMLQVEPARDSGYSTLRETSTQSSRTSSVRSLVPETSSRSQISTRSDRGGLTRSNRGGLYQGYLNDDKQVEADIFGSVPSDEIHQEFQDHNMADEDFPDEDFDDLPLDELDSVIFLENVPTSSDSSYRHTPQNSRTTGNSSKATKPLAAQFESRNLSGSGSRLGSINSRSSTQKRDTSEASWQLTTTPKPFLSPAASEETHESEFASNDEIEFVEEDMDCILEKAETSGKTRGPNDVPVQQEPSRDRESIAYKSETGRSSKKDAQSGSTISPVTLTSPPFTYLSLLENLMSKPLLQTIEIHVKAFIVTLLGKLSSSNGVWSVSATISDGTGYLDVELSNEVLTGLLGFSVAEKGALKRDPSRRGELDAGMRRCQEELVDMCCIMTVIVQPEGRKAVVTKADPVSEKILQELEQRVRDRRK
ncbi:recQ-mediated genome instability protein 1 [Archocentrus centrarchus]|uniref:recQ-mediated genome instability protein 1 n=1 Tax=Archocentrus centrarchus TaxID=63155 RepID=UPI0011EA158D|nr:recQ-mediated genome instability protein 1 [Archocentrus centrarchus]